MSDVSSFLDRVVDKLLTPAGSGFASAVVGSFAKNMVMALFSEGQSCVDDTGSQVTCIPGLVNVICSEKCKELIGDCIQLFVSTAVAVYLEKTKDINTYDEILSGLTNPKHEKEVRDLLLSVCNGAVETLVKTSYQVLTSSSSGSSYLGKDQGQGSFGNGIFGQEALSAELKGEELYDEIEKGGWLGKLLSTLAVPSYRKFIISMTLTITLETVQSFLELLLEKLYDGLKKSVNAVRETLVDGGLQVVRYVSAKCSVVTGPVFFCWSMALQLIASVAQEIQGEEISLSLCVILVIELDFVVFSSSFMLRINSEKSELIRIGRVEEIKGFG
ncbi:Protein phloem 2-like A10 [Vitis vinifera]|uniref:Protein phloem 2-like A10 n=1 Tax=Vitis vinifera TaxID=29760 RepID=A0A438KS27_VITVI|nr:Protein phloem 2-like A10 [Vitis vinifera]